MLSIIDGDIVVYMVAFACQRTRKKDGKIIPAKQKDVEYYLSIFMLDIIKKSGGDEYVVYLTPQGGTFRNEVDEEYKANRKQPKPLHYQTVRDILIEEYGATMQDLLEADDLIASKQTKMANAGKPSIICSSDKDLDQVPGWHYNFHKLKETVYQVNQDEAAYFLAYQMLVGDVADNIKGLKGVGDVKARKILDAVTNGAYFTAAWKAYMDHYPPGPVAGREWTKNYQLLSLKKDLEV